MSRSLDDLTPMAHCFAWLSRTFPRSISDRYGGEMLDAFVRQRKVLGLSEGRWSAFRFSLSACLNVAKEGLQARGHRRIEKRVSGSESASGRGGSNLPVGGRWSPLESLADLTNDVRFALRGLIRAPAFSVVAVLSLAVGIGVNTSLAAIVEAVWLKPVPGVAEQDRLVETVLTEGGREVAFWTYPDFADVRRADTTFEALAASGAGAVSLTADDRTERVSAMFVSANFFRTLGVVISRGRDFLPAEDVGQGQHPVVVVSHDMWQNRLGGDDGILGRTIGLNRSPYTVVGVVPEEFKGVRPLSGATDLWMPITQAPLDPNSLTTDREGRWLRVIGRLRTDATIQETNASLQTVFAGLAAEYPETNEGRSALARSFGRFPAQNRAGDIAAVFGVFVMVALVLLIICGNVAGMMLARSATRERETAVRMALGCGRGRLVRQLMVEALILALAGGAAGILLGFWVTSFVTPARLGVVISDIRFELSGAVLLFSIGLTAAATLVVGLFPALRFSSPQLLSSLKDDAGGGGKRVGRLHRFAASAQTGMALLCLVTCSLFLLATGLVEEKGLGFEPENLLMSRVYVSEDGDGSPAQALALLDRLKESVAAVPGIAAVSIADGIPLDLTGNFTRVSRADQPAEAVAGERVEFTQVGEGFFEVIGTPILRGRAFESGDDAAAEQVVIITQELAEILWPEEEALGQRLSYPSASNPDLRLTVVGVVGHVAASTATQDLTQVFVPLRQRFSDYSRYGLRLMIVMRGALDTGALAAPIQGAILEVDPTLLFPLIVSSDSLVARSTMPQRATANLSAGFGLLALVLSAIGVYGVVAFAVSNRTREIGVRMALGATRRQVLGEVFKDGLRLALPGLVIGGLLAAGTAFIMRSMLFGLSPLDPVSFGVAAAVLLAVVLLASLIPARRASSVDPMNALRYE